VGDDVDIWRYAIVSCMPETTTNGMNQCSFGGDPVPDMLCGSLLHFPWDCRIWHFRRFISISPTVTICFSWNSVEWLMPTREWVATFCEPSSRHPDQSRNPDWNPGSVLVEVRYVSRGVHSIECYL